MNGRLIAPHTGPLINLAIVLYVLGWAAKSPPGHQKPKPCRARPKKVTKLIHQNRHW